MKFEPIKYEGGILKLIDQTRLPSEHTILECRTVEELWQAIKNLSVRGAPLLGIAAAYGICLGIKGKNFQTKDAFFDELKKNKRLLSYLTPNSGKPFLGFRAYGKVSHRATRGINLKNHSNT